MNTNLIFINWDWYFIYMPSTRDNSYKADEPIEKCKICYDTFVWFFVIFSIEEIIIIIQIIICRQMWPCLKFVKLKINLLKIVNPAYEHDFGNV